MIRRKHDILLIENDPDVATFLQLDLEDAGYSVSHAGSVVTGLILAREHPPALVLLALDLPDGTGRDVVVRLRRTSEVPIIVLTNHDVLEERVELLLLGANDCLVKPFEQAELLARIAVQLRQHSAVSLRVGELEVRLQQCLVTYQGTQLLLSPKELEILTLLMQQPGRVYQRQEIQRILWPDRILPLDSNVVDVYISHLRTKLRDAGAYGLLRTVRGYGYALRGPVPTASA